MNSLPCTSDLGFHDKNCSVLIVGSGIAGTCAAVCAAEALQGSGRVLLASAGPLFSGSSFFKGTWGLGLIAPDGPDDEADLAQTIQDVGCGFADPTMVRSFVEGIEPSIRKLQEWGVRLKEPAVSAASERAYVPCFDHKHRRWRGIEREPFVEAMGQQLARNGVCVGAGWELLDLRSRKAAGRESNGPSVPGVALFFDHQAAELVRVSFSAMVLCCGGASGLFPRRLTSGDCTATIHALAEQAGCCFVNLEFMQFMPGLVSPVKGVVFNEKVFGQMELPVEVVERLGGTERAAQLLDQRSGYGPFTSRLASRAIDEAIHAAGPEGLALTPRLSDRLPEFARTYFDWLQKDFGVGPHDTVRVCHYAHASNGGIAIGTDGSTGVLGLFAAGECTGGMHGADRLGGLSSANGLVFGMRAGATAARFAQAAGSAGGGGTGGATAAGGAGGGGARGPLPRWTTQHSPFAQNVKIELGRLMERNCGIIRTEEGLDQALQGAQSLIDKLASTLEPAPSLQEAALTRRTFLQLRTARLMLAAAQSRSSSAGSHFRQ